MVVIEDGEYSTLAVPEIEFVVVTKVIHKQDVTQRHTITLHFKLNSTLFLCKMIFLERRKMRNWHNGVKIRKLEIKLYRTFQPPSFIKVGFRFALPSRYEYQHSVHKNK